MFRFETVDLEVDGNQALKLPMIEQQINSIFRTVEFDHVLIAYEREIAPHFDQKLADVGQNGLFEFVFRMGIG